MSYYNYVLVVFMRNGQIDIRSGCQALPGGAIPICIIDANNKRIVEITNDKSREEILEFVKKDDYTKEGFEGLETFEYFSS